jgi:hypothetical protein
MHKGIDLTIAAAATNISNGAIVITGNDFSAIVQEGGTPITYSPNNESVIIKNNMGIEDMTGSLADATTISPTVSLPTFAITGTGTDIANIGTKWFANGRIEMIPVNGPINFVTGGNICNALTGVAVQTTVYGRWNVGSNCWNLK